VREIKMLVLLALACGAYQPTPTQLGLAINGTGISGRSVSVSGNVVAIGAPEARSGAGLVQVHVWDGTSWNQRGADIVGADVASNAGWSVALSTNTVVIGSPGYNNDAGLVQVYVWNGTHWVQRGSNILASDGFGSSLSMSNGSIAVGSLNTEAVRVYDFNDAWVPRGAVLTGDVPGDLFGYSVALSDNVLAVGAPYGAGNGQYSGYVRVYDYKGTAWVQRAVDRVGGAGYMLGWSVALSDGALAIGSPAADSSAGRVEVFKHNGTVWVPRGPALLGVAGSQFGLSLAFDGTLVVGAPHAAPQIPTARVFDYGTAWVQRGPTLNGTVGSDFGYSVAVSGGMVAVGAPQYLVEGVAAGQVTVYNYGRDSDDDGLGPGEIAGIVIGACVLVAGVGLAIYHCRGRESGEPLLGG
jgi:hypothetical protein